MRPSHAYLPISSQIGSADVQSMKCFLNARSHLRAIRRPTPLRELQIVRLRSADGIKGRSHFASECPTVCPILKCWHSFGVPSDSSWSAFEPCLFEPESLFPGNGILCAGTKATKFPRKIPRDASRDEITTTSRPIRRQLPHGREISLKVGMRGGAGRTRTSEQEIMSLRVSRLPGRRFSPFSGGLRANGPQGSVLVIEPEPATAAREDDQRNSS